MKIQEPSSSIRETERKESPEWQCTSVPPLEGTREWQNPVTTTFLSQESLQGRCPSSRGALPRPHVLVSQRNARILYATETTRLPTGHGFTLPQRHTVFMRAGRRLGVSAQMGGELLIFYLCTDPFLRYDDKESSSTSVENTWDACRWIVTTM